MKIDLSLQFNHDMTLPMMPVKVRTGSALPLELTGIPATLGGKTVTAVTVKLTTAEGAVVEGVAVKLAAIWYVLFAPSCFTVHGYVSLGVKVAAVIDGTDIATVSGDLEVKPSSADIALGDPTLVYQLAGGDVYKKTTVVDGVQHYVKEVMVYDEEIGWGLDWTGDYVRDDSGEFVEAGEVAE